MRAATKRSAMRERLTARRLGFTLAVLVLLLALLVFIAIALGSEHLSLNSVMKIIVAEVSGRAADVPLEQRIIIAEIRIPRILMAIAVGAALSVAGAAYQALLRNPLADPYI